MSAWNLNKYALMGIVAALALLTCIAVGPFFIDEGNVTLPPRRTPTATPTAAEELVSMVVTAQDSADDDEQARPTATLVAEATATPSTGTATLEPATPSPALTATPDGPRPPELIEAGVVRDEGIGQYAWFAIVANPNAAWYFENVTVRVVDTSGGNETEVAALVLQTLYAGERAGLGELLSRQSETEPDDYEVRVEPGRAVQGADLAPVSAQRVSWQPAGVGGQVSALVRNQSAMAYFDISVLGVVRDDAGSPLAVRPQLLSFIPNQSETGAVIQFPNSSGGTGAELFLAHTSSTRAAAPPPPPLVDLVAQGLVRESASGSALWAAVFESHHDSGTVAASEVLLTLLDASDTVVAVQTVDVPDIRPRARAAVVVALTRTAGAASPARAIAHVRYGNVVEDSPGTIAVEETLYLEDQNIPRVEGYLRSAVNRDLEDLPLVAIAYGEGGEIAGAGRATAPELQANGWTFAQVRLTLDDDTAGIERAELFVLWTDELGAASAENRVRGLLLTVPAYPNGLGHPGTNDSAAI